jgi:hypothetical protein
VPIGGFPAGGTSEAVIEALYDEGRGRRREGGCARYPALGGRSGQRGGARRDDKARAGAAEEGAVYLQGVSWEPAQVRERAVAGTEVVDRDANPEPLE